MNDVTMWIIIGIVCAALVAAIVVYIIKIVKMSPEERKKTIITYLKGLVALAESEIGSGKGEEKLALVEEYFNEHAPWFIKTLLFVTGKDSLKDLIELALSEVKDAFGESTPTSKVTETKEETKEISE